MPTTQEILKGMDGVAGASWSGFIALTFVTETKIWPVFAAFATSLAGEPFTEQDRIGMMNDRNILHRLAEKLDELTESAKTTPPR